MLSLVSSCFIFLDPHSGSPWNELHKMNFVQRCGIPEGMYYKSYSKQASSFNPNILILLNSLLMFHDKRNVSSAMTRVPDYTTLSSFHSSCPTSSTFCSYKRMLVLQTKWRKTVQLSFLRLPPCFACIPHFTIQFSSVAQSFLSLRNPLNHRTLGLPVHHQLPEDTQTHLH